MLNVNGSWSGSQAVRQVDLEVDHAPLREVVLYLGVRHTELHAIRLPLMGGVMDGIGGVTEAARPPRK